jgi:hypothetical protein
MPYVIKHSQKWTSKIDTIEVATAKEALEAVRGLDASDEDVRSVRFPDGREFETYRNIVRWQGLLKELELRVKQDSK